MSSIYVGLIWVAVLAMSSVDAKQCIRTAQCTCEMDDGSGIVNLNGIATRSDGSARFSILGWDGWMYTYNPCSSFVDNIGYFTDLAVRQSSGYQAYDLGVQSSESFNYTYSSGVIIQYIAGDTYRKSRVNLICNRNLQQHKLEFIGELISTEYDFVLEGPCACAGGCDKNGVIAPPTVEPAKPCNDNSELSWNVVGFDLVSLIIHDLILVFVIGGILAVLVYVCGYQFGRGKGAAGSGGIGNVNIVSDA